MRDLSSARHSLLKTLHMDQEGLFPDSIRPWMLSIPCRRLLREVHGGKWRAIWAWVWGDMKSDACQQWTNIRTRFYLTDDEEAFVRESQKRDP